jgi:ubiquinone/menaquinone biosynthesis C-methylase UbiE
MSKSFENEETRVQAAFIRRQGDEERYSWFNSEFLYRIQERERRVLLLLKRHGCTPLNRRLILDVGCGTGHWLREFVKWGFAPENIIGIELLPHLISKARKLSPKAVRLKYGSAAKLEFPDATFDLVFQSMVFTSVLDPELKRQIASEILRVLKPDGMVLWYDFYVNNPKNRDVKGIKKREIYQLFPDCRIELSRITLAPPCARVLARYSPLACQLLEKLNIFNTHYLGVISRPGAFEIPK